MTQAVGWRIHFSNGRNSADIIADGRRDQSFFGDSIFDSTDKVKIHVIKLFLTVEMIVCRWAASNLVDRALGIVKANLTTI